MIVQSSKQPYTLEILQQPYENPANIKGCYKLLKCHCNEKIVK